MLQTIRVFVSNAKSIYYKLMLSALLLQTYKYSQIHYCQVNPEHRNHGMVSIFSRVCFAVILFLFFLIPYLKKYKVFQFIENLLFKI